MKITDRDRPTLVGCAGRPVRDVLLWLPQYRRVSPRNQRHGDALSSPVCRVLSNAIETLFSIAEVHESHKPYGMLPGDPPT